MALKIGTDKYTFCINSNYYEILLKYVKDNKTDVDNEQKCENLTTNMMFSNNELAKNICQEFKFLCKSFSKYQYKEAHVNYAFSNYDYDFLNYWLNDKLRENVNNGFIQLKEFYDEIKRQDGNFLYTPKDLEKHLHVIDPNILENMKLIYKLYDNAVKIKSIIDNEVYTSEEEKNKEQESCSKYTKECDENYKEAMHRCLNSNDDFYNALKNFKDAYDIITKPSSNESNACNSSEFYYFPEYDAVLEKKANAIKISSTLLVLSFALPLIYKYTPFGPFLRANINKVKKKWMNSNEYGSELSSLPTDVEGDISDNEEYNIGYFKTN
ncbi:PIR Superfamily Protein [Plasmodium ovale curtisi]|uniref:PIR Superfamily Protein n=1 Tax=Plasmodium ovale curtisi TaxID=864141 RepID=A0A1A8WMR6_PLAOA|nr:PIR Superfamily Protein [Plasmodium ovale curtisi]